MSNPNTLVARTRRSLMALAVAALLLVVAAFSAHAQTTKIAFDRGGNIWTMDPDGRAETRVSDTYGISPSWRVVPVQDAKPEQTLAASNAGLTK